MVATNGKESPRWGYLTDCKPNGGIEIGGQNGSPVIGVKFFMNKINRAVTYEDVVVQGVQALERH